MGPGRRAAMERVRYCPRCDSEYRLEILTCAECGGELEVREEGYHPPPQEPFPDVADGADEPPGEYRSLYYSGEIADLEPLTDALGESRIPYRVDAADDTKVPLSPHNRFYLKVRDEEREQARQLLESLPQATELGIVDDLAEKNFDPGKGYRNCPACSASIPAGARKCPDCGLALSGSMEPLVCSACGWEVSSADTACPKCGAALED
jgi:double zinc ribbon protein